MAPPGNGVFIVRGELATLITAMKRGNRWNSSSIQDDDQDGLIKQLIDLKNILTQIEDLKLVDPMVYLSPILDVVRSEETTGSVTSLALQTINKFLSYGLIDPTLSSLASMVENIADAVTHARFVGTDQISDGAVLMKILQVLRTLMLSPEGSSLTNESVCEIMLSCFRICFEPRLHELLRRDAEHVLKDIVLLMFMRLPQFANELHSSGVIKKLRMSASLDRTDKTKKTKLNRTASLKTQTSKDPMKEDEKAIDSQVSVDSSAKDDIVGATITVDNQGSMTQSADATSLASETDNDVTTPLVESTENDLHSSMKTNDTPVSPADPSIVLAEKEKDKEDFVNAVGVRFTPKAVNGSATAQLVPYGLPCVRELLRFLISLCNPMDKQNSDVMILTGLNLLTIAFEVGADYIGRYETLIGLVKDDLCRNLFTLLNNERVTIFGANLQLCFLLFESLRSHLKLQLECYLTKLSEIVASENIRIPYEVREMALDNILQLFRIPGFATELFVNYDCDLYCSNLFEDLTKLLSKYALSASQIVYSTHNLSMEALLTVIDGIAKNCAFMKAGGSVQVGRHYPNDTLRPIIDANVNNAETTSPIVKSFNSNFVNETMINSTLQAVEKHDELIKLKARKKLLTQGTEFFNQQPNKGILFLQENALLSTPLIPVEVVKFLRENHGLDKTMIGDYISKKKNVELGILLAFVESFDFTNTRIDIALRQYLETFRLPGEAPLIFLVMEHFAEHWHKCNAEPFSNTDAAFRLAYAIIMLNIDQHNSNAKKSNIPMTVDDFRKNLRGLNGNSDFDQEMLAEIYNSIKNNEIVMPAEQVGIVKENYLWKVLLRRGEGKDGTFSHVFDASFDSDVFQILWGSALSALGSMFDKCSEKNFEKPIIGFTKCALISSFYNLNANFDALILTLCKFSTLLSIAPEINEISASVTFGTNQRAQLALKTAFAIIHEHGDCLRESWKSIFEVITQLFRLKLLPKTFTEVEDFCDPSGKTTLIVDKPIQKTEASLFSSLYSYLSSDGQRQPSYEEQEIINAVKKCVKECQLDQIIIETKFIQLDSLAELINCLLQLMKPPTTHKSLEMPYSEDLVVFSMEMLVKILIQNRDRLIGKWTSCRDQFYLLLTDGSANGYNYLLIRTTIGLLKLAIYLMRNEDLCPEILQSLQMFLLLKPSVIHSISKEISIGIYELLKTSAQNIHSENDWAIVFNILECVGAGAQPPNFDENGTKSDGAVSEEDAVSLDRGYTSDPDNATKTIPIPTGTSPTTSPALSPSGDNWILVNRDADVISVSAIAKEPIAQIETLAYPCKLLKHSPFALIKCWDSLAFIVRNVAHITPYNFELCVKCIRTFVEAVFNGGRKYQHRKNARVNSKNKRIPEKKSNSKQSKGDLSSDEEDEESLAQSYETIAIQLLDLMHTLHTRTAQIFRWWAEEGGVVPQYSALWAQGWCPLLQGISRLSTDHRRPVRVSAITCLQRALLVHDLQTLTGPEWLSCFKKVLFPLLNDLLSENATVIREPGLLEESRMRSATIMSKVFLHHLNPLIALPTFTDLWMEILDYIEKFMKNGTDMLYEAMLESLKNMLLVMHSIKSVFHNSDGITHSPLWDLTWQRINEFLPNLKDEIFKETSPRSTVPTVPNQQPVNRIDSIIQQIPAVDILPGSTINNLPKPIETVEKIDTVEKIESPRNASLILQPLMTSVPTVQGAVSPILLAQQSASPPSVPLFIPQMGNQELELNMSTQSQQPVPMFYPTIPAPTQLTLNNPIYSPAALSSVQSNSEESISVISPEQSPTHEIVKPAEMLPPPQQLDLSNYQFQGGYGNNFSPEHHNVLPISQSPPTMISANNDEIPTAATIPISHLTAPNAYPSLTKVPVNIVQSFAPGYVEPVKPPETGEDIFNDYVKNPYNLTLAESTVQSNVEQTSPPVANMFQSANYFGTYSTNIPPGSEFLYGDSFPNNK